MSHNSRTRPDVMKPIWGVERCNQLCSAVWLCYQNPTEISVLRRC